MTAGMRLIWWRSLWQQARPVDRLVVGYLVAFALGMAVLGSGDPSWGMAAAIQLALAAAILAMIHAWPDQARGMRGFLRVCYPAMLYPVFYLQMRGAIHWVFPAFFDHQIVALEKAVLGVDLNVWLLPIQKPVLNELFMLGYFSYYLLIPALVIPLFVRGEREAIGRVLHACTVAFVVSYVGFVLYPLEGPRYFLSGRLTQQLGGWVFVPTVRAIIAKAAIHGGCMPSSHAAVALVVLVWARRTLPRLAALMIPLVFLLFVATVWGHFHYVSDLVAGWLVGAAALWLAGKLPTCSRGAIVSGDTHCARVVRERVAV